MSKIKVNKNFIWAKAFVNQLCDLGVRFACISPGSRSTPLTLAFAEQKKIKCFVHIDERVSGFFALGLAKSSGLPVAIVTTSGTATGELYPAIIEAFQQRIPLIICTADRPPELLNTGANQTINQWNLYKNHIRWFKYIGLPQLTVKRISVLQKITLKAFDTSLNKGPVHLNFPFRKPLEPKSFTDEVDDKILMTIKNCITPGTNIHNRKDLSNKQSKQINRITEKIIVEEKGLIIVGPNEYNREFVSKIKHLSKVTGYPVLADGVSHLRFKANISDKNICCNYNAYLRSKKFRKNYKPGIILQFGRTITSVFLQNYMEQSKPLRFLINEYGDLFDPSKSSKPPIKIDPNQFCKNVIQLLNENNLKRNNSNWLKLFKEVESISEEIKDRYLNTIKLNIEPKVFSELISIIPSNTKIVVGNSLPIRDFDNFVGKTNKNLKVFFNRGASGIDGVTSTALGIASLEKPTILITGDLSFLHDLNALLPAKKYSIRLIVILINNNGGGIFEMLPVSSSDKFNMFFKTPHNLNIAPIVKSFGIGHQLIKDTKDFKNKLKNTLLNKSLTVLELKTDSRLSKEMRRKYWADVVNNIESRFSLK